MNGPAFTKLLTTPRTAQLTVTANYEGALTLGGVLGTLQLSIFPRHRDLVSESLYPYLTSYQETSMSAADCVRSIAEDLSQRLGNASVTANFASLPRVNRPDESYTASAPA